jgi:dTDP-4-amino-4,6-dideoxygalactose transaminase
MFHVCEIAKRHNLIVIEDACMGIGGKHKEIPHGRFGNIGAFSMHPLKSLNVMGDGGMLVTDDSEKYEWMSMYRNHGMTDRDHIKVWGVNMRIQPIQAIVATLELPKINQIIISRNQNAKFLDTELEKLIPHIKIPYRNLYDLNTYSLYMVECEKRDQLINHLRAKSIDAKIHYPVPLHLQDAAKSLGDSKGSFPIAESQAMNIITLPVHQFLDSDQLIYMVNCIKDFYSKN